MTSRNALDRMIERAKQNDLDDFSDLVAETLWNYDEMGEALGAMLAWHSGNYGYEDSIIEIMEQMFKPIIDSEL